MNSLQDLAQMTRDYGLARYFALTSAVVAVLMLVLFVWGHRPDESTDSREAAQGPAATHVVPAAPSEAPASSPPATY
jgi:hypothetical protein